MLELVQGFGPDARARRACDARGADAPHRRRARHLAAARLRRGTLGGCGDGRRAGPGLSGALRGGGRPFGPSAWSGIGHVCGIRRDGARSIGDGIVTSRRRRGTDDRLSRRCGQDRASGQRRGDRRRCARLLRRSRDDETGVGDARPRHQARACIRPRCFPTRRDAPAWSSGSFTMPDMHGREARPTARTPIPPVRTQPAKCCASSARTGSSRAARDDRSVRSRTVAA